MADELRLGTLGDEIDASAILQSGPQVPIPLQGDGMTVPIPLQGDGMTVPIPLQGDGMSVPIPLQSGVTIPIPDLFF